MSSCTATGSSGDDGRPPSYKAIGIALAVSSGCFIGVSFVIKKVGLLKANAKYHEEAGEGYGYLKNAWWWLGMTLMIVGEICNFVAYMFTDAILITPLGALSVVITTILSAIFLNERLSFVGKVGCFLCVLGSITIPLNAPTQSAVSTIQEMQCFVISPGFLTYAGILVVGCVVIAFWLGPKYGKKSMLIYLSVCSLMGGLSVVATQGLGAAILSQINGHDTTQFKHWFLYILFVFVIGTLVTEIIFLNKALNIFNTALVTPTYYVYFTSTTIVTSAILFRGFHGTPQSIATIVLGFLTICSGVVLLQFSKSAKDVPDNEVLTGDLDQMKAVAAQQENESEPKADTIRGAAALLRTFSKSRRQAEQDEARRMRTDSLEPIGEDELVEWDGLRRRKTVLRPGETREQALSRKKTMTGLPPARFHSTRSATTDGTAENDPDHHPHGGLAGLRTKAASMLAPRGGRDKARHASDSSFLSEQAALNAERNADPHAYMTQTRVASGGSAYTEVPDVDEADLSSMHRQGTGALGPAFEPASDTAYKGAGGSIRFTDRPSTANSNPSVAPTPPPHGGGDNRRAFSFLHRHQRSTSSGEHGTPSTIVPGGEHVTASPRSGSSSIFTFKRGHGGSASANLRAVTEEERLGLVMGGDSERSRHGGAGAGREGLESSDDDRRDEDDEEDSEEFESIGLKDFGSDGERRRYYDGGPPGPGGGGGGGFEGGGLPAGKMASRQSLV